jgi:rRNA small subunit pseudouridine methyltransferase Nep1
MPLNIILVECGLELIPKKIRNHPSVKRNFSKKLYASQLLDVALHHSAMRILNDFNKRGRPDILHICLLNALSSVLNKTGHLNLYFHTYKNRLFKLNPEIRISKNYNRFKGLMAKLLIDGMIKAEKEILIYELNKSIDRFISQSKSSKVYIMTEDGDFLKSYKELFNPNLDDDYVVIIGGFQKGKFSNSILNLSEEKISLSNYPLTAWVTVYKILTYYEIINNIS